MKPLKLSVQKPEHGVTLTVMDWANIKNWLKSVKPSMWIRVSFSVIYHDRSLKQNKFYWKYIVGILADELGYDKDSMHETLKAKFLREPHDTIPGVFRVKSTTELSTIEFIQYYKEVQVWAADFLNIYLPDPNEHLDKDIKT